MTTLDDDLLVEHMRKHGMPITRENYIRLNYGAEPPREWTLEHELELPDELQDWTWIEQHYPGFYGKDNNTSNTKD
jgi:hypothetical protein